MSPGELTPLERAVRMVRDAHAELDRVRAEAREPIAIIGIGCRFPGGVDGPEAYWDLLTAGVDAITDVPADRWDVDTLDVAQLDAEAMRYIRHGGFLDRIDDFDAEFFGIPSAEARRMDPQQRLLLEVAWEALERAGQNVEGLADSRTGVFVGISTNDYAVLNSGDLTAIDQYSGTGNAFSVASGRLSFFLNLRGPNLALDTACSSSLVAVHLACQSLRLGESAMALAGGVNLILTPDTTTYLSRLNALAPDGRCKTFDAAADGYARGEGCGVVVLKRLSDARRDGDPVLAVIRGSAVNHDGRSIWLTAPNGAAQEEVIDAALRSGGVDPTQVGFVEAHGTGTLLGDPIELQALASVTGPGRPEDRSLVVGSVKTNFGHLEAASGIAGLIKAVLAIRHAEIPPHLHFENPNPHLSWDTLKVVVPRESMAWPAAYPERIAGVSSFGISGTNAHIVLANAPETEPIGDLPTGPCILPLSARHPEALNALAERVQGVLETSSLYDLCYTAAARRSHHASRLAVVGNSQEELAERLAAYAIDTAASGEAAGPRRKVAFVFGGQGGQWIGMGRELLRDEPVFRASIAESDEVIRHYAGWSLLDVLTGDCPHQIDVIQPALFAVQRGLAALWESWGIAADAVVGHSMGEVAAACVAGALSLEDAAKVICRRSLLLQRIAGRGAMAVVELSLSECEAYLRGYEDRVSIAVNSSARSAVLSGDEEAVDALLAVVERDGVFCRRINVDVASHSPHVDDLRSDLMDALDGLTPQAAEIPMYSTVTGEVSYGHEFDARYWVKNLRQPVMFAHAMKALIADGHDIFVEVGPHPILLPSVADNLKEAGREGTCLASLRRDEPERSALLESLGELYVLGQSPNWRAIYPQPGNVVSLPAYPWQREQFWMTVEPKGAGGTQLRSSDAPLGAHVQPADRPGSHLWEHEVSLRSFPYLRDHRVGDMAVFPAAASVDLVLAAAREVLGDGAIEVENFEFKKMLVVPEDSAVAIQVSVDQDRERTARVRIASRPSGSGESWMIIATGTLRVAGTEEPGRHSTHEALRRCTEKVAGADYYRGLAAQGLEYGPSFTGITELRRQPGEVVAHIRPVETLGRGHPIHPALLDMCFQAVGAALPGWHGLATVPDAIDGPYLPVGIDTLLWHGNHHGDLTVHTQLTFVESDVENVRADIWVCDEDGRVAVEVRGFRVQRLSIGRGLNSTVEDWMYRLEWQDQPLTPDDRRDPDSAWLLLDGGSGLAQAIATRIEARGGVCAVATPGKRYRRIGERRFEWNPAERADYMSLLQDGLVDVRGAGILHILAAGEWEGDVPMSVVSLIQAIDRSGRRDAPKLALVTAGAHDDSPALDQAPVWGIGRTVAVEHPELRCTCVDLSASPIASELDSLCDEIRSGTAENQVMLRGAERRVARLISWHPGESEPDRASAGDRNFRLEIDTPGILDRLILRAFHAAPPGPGSVQIRVHAAALNFLDVLAAMGVRPDLPEGGIQLGGECAGTVVAVGEGVEGIEPGDEVIAIAPHSLGTVVTTPAAFVVRKPPRLSFEEAATIPIAFLTAYLAFVSIGRLQPGERVLIHSASGGVGLAAIEVAHWIGAEVFATAGNPEKRQFLRDLGIQHVFDSRRHGILAGVMEATGGQGVDVVLNSLTGDALAESLEALAPYGRFLEIGKKDVYENRGLDLFPFHRNLTYSFIDLARMLPEKSEVCSTLLHEIVGHIETGLFRPLRYQSFPIGLSVEAFHEMAQARHIGKIVVSLGNSEDVTIAPPTDVPVRADGTYLITGGFGGLGLLVAGWLVEHGAGSIMLMGRSEPADTAAVERMRALGARIEIGLGDVSDAEQVRAVISTIDSSMLPLRGIIHAAGILDDRTLLTLDAESLHAVMAPKVSGAWNLHLLTQDRPLDFFVLYSSGSALLGTAGQANYAAANAYLDALAGYRYRRELPALSIDWGPFSGVGMVPDQVARLREGGMGSLTPEQGTDVLGQLLGQNCPQIAVLPIQAERWQQRTPLLAQILSGEEDPTMQADDTLRSALAGGDERQCIALLEAHLRDQLAGVLRIPAARIGTQTPFNALQLDSLMALQLRNRLEGSLGLSLPATLVWKYPTVGRLASYLAGLVSPSVNGSEAAEPVVVAIEPASALDRIADLSDEDVERLFAERIGGASGE